MDVKFLGYAHNKLKKGANIINNYTPSNLFFLFFLFQVLEYSNYLRIPKYVILIIRDCCCCSLIVEQSLF